MGNHKFGFSNGVVHARYVNPALVTLTASSTNDIDLNASKGEVFKLTPMAQRILMLVELLLMSDRE